MSVKSQGKRCRATTKSGKPCQAAATEGGLCFFHANPNKASELGRIGGRSNRHSVTGSADPLPKLESAMAVREAVGKLIADVYAGKLNPRVAAGLAPLMSLQLRTIEATDLERRLAKLEKLISEAPAEEGLSRTEHPIPYGNLPSHFSPADSPKATSRIGEDPEIR